MRETNQSTVRVAIIVSHPIQHFVPLYRQLARTNALDLKVFFCSKLGLEKYNDREMGVEIAWDMDLLGGYQSAFLAGAGEISDMRFWSVNNGDVEAQLAAFAPAVVVIYGYSQITMIRAIAWSHFKGVPAVMISDSELVQNRPIFVRLIKRLLLKRLFQAFSAFLTVGDNNEAYYLSYGVDAKRLVRSPFTIDEELFQGIRAQRQRIRSAFRRELRIPEDDFVILFVGKLSVRKRPHDIVDAVAKLSRLGKSGAPICAIFAGDGELRKSLEEEASSGALPCRFLGFVNLKTLPMVYAAADAYVHPSERDPHPLATCEAAYMGLPLILSDKVGSIGVSDTARAGLNAMIYPCGDTEALARAIQQIASNKSLSSAMSMSSLQVATETGLAASVSGFVKAVLSVTRE